MKLCKNHQNRKAKALELCNSCYEKHLKSVNPEYKKRQNQNSSKWSKLNPEALAEYRKKRRDREEKSYTKEELALKKRNVLLKRKYGIDHEGYLLLLKGQGGKCAICLRKPAGDKRFHIDHCHKTGRVRGVLCHQCNWYLATVESDRYLLCRINEYLKGIHLETNNYEEDTLPETHRIYSIFGDL